MFATKTMDHDKYPQSLRAKSEAELRFIIKDCQESIDQNPENPNNGFYADEINYAAMEIHRRNKSN